MTISEMNHHRQLFLVAFHQMAESKGVRIFVWTLRRNFKHGKGGFPLKLQPCFFRRFIAKNFPFFFYNFIILLMKAIMVMRRKKKNGVAGSKKIGWDVGRRKPLLQLFESLGMI